MRYIEKILDFELFKIATFSISVHNVLIIAFIVLAVIGITRSVDLYIKKRLSQDGNQDDRKGKSIGQLVKYIIYILGFYFAANSIGFDLSILLGAFAVLGLGIGFALQDLVKDIISGILILFEGNVSVGDILELDSLVGTVTEIKLRTSVIKTRNGVYIVVPNSRVVNETVINWTKSNRITRFNVVVGVAYGSDVNLVKELLLKSANDHQYVSTSPEAVVFFTDFGDSALTFEVNFWLEDTWQTQRVKSDVRFSIDKLFRENNIQIPFPQRDVHLIQK